MPKIVFSLRLEELGVAPSVLAAVGVWGVWKAELDGEGRCDVMDDAARRSEERFVCPSFCARATLGDIDVGGTMTGVGNGGGRSVGFFLNILPNNLRGPERSAVCCVGDIVVTLGTFEGGVGVD